jgi:3D (Asp-Asp-Asp) domain-containing protein
VKRAAALLSSLLALVMGATSAGADDIRTLIVKASAYNSLPAQTDSDPNLGAWGDVLTPGVKAIAVSRDLIALGITRGVEVSIEGLPGTYRVLDKMDRRWEKKIDIYMGDDVEAARRWGVRNVRVQW